MGFNDLNKATTVGKELLQNHTRAELLSIVKVIFNDLNDKERRAFAFFLVNTNCIQRSDIEAVELFRRDY